MIRNPIVAGQFYESDSSKLMKQLEQCFRKSESAGKKQRKAKAIISPHAGYMFSGPTAAYGFNELAAADVYVILGLSHAGYETCVSYSDWKTPLGVLKNDIEFSKALGLENDEDAHADEHSIEVQLPFLQFANMGRLDKIKICPIIVNSVSGVAEKIAKVASVQKKKIAVIVSSDFPHYGPNYDYVPFVSNIKENLHKLDNQAIQKILKLDIKGFQEFIDRSQATICGQKPIIALLEYLKIIGCKNAKLLNYTTSGEVLNDFTNAVGYASIAFY